MAGLSHGDPFSRRRRQNALDGSVPGISYNRFLRGSHPAGSPTPADLTERLIRIDLPHPTNEYDPVHPQYPEPEGYGPPDPWDAIELGPRMPRFRLDPPDRPGPRPPTYAQSVAFARMINGLIEQVRDLRTAGEPVPAHLAEIYDSMLAPRPLGVDADPIGVSPLAQPVAPTPEMGFAPLPGPSLDDLAMEMTTMPVVEMASDPLEAMSVFEPGPTTAALNFDPLETNLSELPDALMPTSEPVASPEGPMSDAPDPIGDAYAMTLDALVEQMMPEPAPPPEMPDPYMQMEQQFNLHMQMMDPFGPPGPMM
jgi:hypothetical protein